MPSRAATIESAEFGHEGGWRDLLRRALGRNPLDAIGIVLLLVAAGAILANALYRQPGPHPAPIFSVKPRPVATAPAEIVPPLPRTRRSEEHTSELQSRTVISYAVFCLKKKKK